MYHKYALFILLNILIVQNALVESKEEEYHHQEEKQTTENTYDYIVVGLGQGGSVAAARLAENGKFKVLGIEWGGRTHASLNGTDYVASSMYIDKDGNYHIGKPYTRFDVPLWANGITVAPTAYPPLTAVFNGKVASVNVGKYLGGSSAHNGQIFSRHTRDTVNSWGVDEWSYDDVLPFWKKTENVSASTQANYPQYHGLKGPIQVSDTPQNEFYSAVPLLEQSCLNLGYPANPDFNGASRYGCGKQVFSIGRGVRFSAAHGYLPNALKRGNLKLELHAKATKLLIKEGPKKGSEPIVYGVEYHQDGVFKKVYADKEIVVASSGVFTPQLLLLSGIGPAEDLKKLGIKVWADNKNVGKNLQSNQVGLGAYNYPTADYGTAYQLPTTSNEYAINGTGPWSHPGQYAYAYVCSKPVANCTNPDVMIGTAVGGFWGAPGSASPLNSLTTQVSNATPKVRSTISLLSTDPFALVNVTQNTYAFKEDLDAQIYGWRLIRKWLSTYPASTIIEQELSPGMQYQTDAELATWIKANTFASTHWVGSTKFGNAGDATRVTDPQLRVVGVKNLRIGDGGIFPSVNSHLQASAAMAGERVADFILRGY